MTRDALGAVPERTVPDRFVVAGAKLFRERGFSASSMRELAAIAGIQKATLYHHIKTKESLLLEICTRSLGRITTEVARAMRSEPPSERLGAMVRAHVTTALDERDMHAVMLFELKALSPD